MKKRKGIAVLLILILSLAVTACGDRYGVKEGESYIYCMNTDKTGLVKVAAKISGNSAIKKAESVISLPPYQSDKRKLRICHLNIPVSVSFLLLLRQ